MDSKPSQKEAAAAAANIIGCYPEIIASDRKIFTAGLVAMLMNYPTEVVQLATDPVVGIPGVVDRHQFTLAGIRKHLDEWAAKRAYRLLLQRRREQQLLPQPPRDPEKEKLIYEGLKGLSDYLARGHGQSVVQ
jgi:hypothetical protein